MTKDFTPTSFETILYGASYYHEYMPEDRLDKDITLMSEAGLSVVRMGESTWSLWEPTDGAFETAWMDRTLDAMHKAGIKAVIGTPTYSIPTWMARKYPEILAVRADNKNPTYGMRQNMDTDHAAYRFYCQRIIRRLISHYADHPAVIGWQIDNETASYGAQNRDVFIGFVEWLKARYGTLEALNKAWLTTFWGQNISTWEDVLQQDRPASTGYRLDWLRWQKQRVTNFLRFQAEIVREYRGPGQFILQNFSPGLHLDVDEAGIAELVDHVAVNPYHGYQDHMTGHPQALNGDFYRSLKQKNFLVTEINAQAIGWGPHHQYPPYDGQARLDVYTHISNGANMVAYWHWHSLHSGQETYWRGVLGHDLEPNRFYGEVSRTAQELKRIGPALVNLTKRNDVAVLYSGDSQTALDIMPITMEGHAPDMLPWEKSKSDYQGLIFQLHKALFDLNVEADFIGGDTEDLARYKLIVLPAFYVASDVQLERLAAYVRHGGHVLASFKTGFTNEHGAVRATRAPGPLRQAAGFSYQEFSSLEHPIALKGELAGNAAHWAELLVLEGATALAHYDHKFFRQWAAVTTNSYGKGRFTYMGSWLDLAAQSALVRRVVGEAGITILDGLPPTVRIRRATSNAGKPLIFLFNYGDDAVTLPVGAVTGRNMLTETALDSNQTLTIGGWDVLVAQGA
ncbi:beta-galactosidase [Devosia sp. BK]|uniref:beta-galactosidase n=1 Tax=Devosia sp. BK TaxID=2871706 RepID=UPI00293B5E25|nr:beta-galactosidase [Devosia sp. BK]MDV3253765.1 beta-galactosidase [Devosia sp. BK]